MHTAPSARATQHLRVASPFSHTLTPCVKHPDARIPNAQRWPSDACIPDSRRAYPQRVRETPQRGHPPISASQTYVHQRVHPSLRTHISLHISSGDGSPYLLSPATIYHLQVSTRC